LADFLPFLIFLMILALFLEAGPALTVFYLIIGTFLLGLWWQKHSLKHLEVTRDYEDHAYLGEVILVRLTIENKSILPILWLEIHESLPVNLRAGRDIKEVFSLGIRGKKVIEYEINTLKRGFYTLGPLVVNSGDPLGLTKPSQEEFPSAPMTVYPKIVSLESLGLPSRSPFGTINHHNPVFEDPTRLMGKRGFVTGDSIRKIDWKSTAATGQLQVKLYEASIALEVAILLDLDKQSYDIQSFYGATELAVTAAASLAAWGQRHNQPVGLFTNGFDPLIESAGIQPLLPKKGTGHFINILEILARIQPGESLPPEQLLQDARGQLSWGTTFVYISGMVRTEVIQQLYQSKKTGMNPVLMITGRSSDLVADRKTAVGYHIPYYTPQNAGELQTLGVDTR
jgi:uncharacterized protein (DUF58 family)